MRRIDYKHHVEGDKIIKTTNGQEVPLEEPLALFRARDNLALPMLLHYRDLCILSGCTSYQLESINHLVDDFKRFKDANPEVMKQPGITKGK